MLSLSDGLETGSDHAAFTTFGMFILDDIEWLPASASSPPTQHNLIGGAGTYAVLGARLCLDSNTSKMVSWIVDTGSDFPDDVVQTIRQWNTDCHFRHDDTRLTTRAWNGYSADGSEHRAFEYRTPKRRLEVSSLSISQIQAKSFHMVCSADRADQLSRELIDVRRAACDRLAKPIVVWEPIPDLCTPNQLAEVQRVMELIDIVSPNAEELRSFFTPEEQLLSQNVLVRRFMNWSGASANPTVCIIREGAQGATLYLPSEHFSSIHFPAYHDADLRVRVVDPTGGGNTFLGAVAVALTDAVGYDPVQRLIIESLCLSHHHDHVRKFVKAMVYALIAASYAIEQYGVPSLRSQGTSETWNGEAFFKRVEFYLDRDGAFIKEQLEDGFKR